jgi:hypothetical protein
MKRPLQFTLRQLAIAVLVVSACLTGYALYSHSKQQSLIQRIYKRNEVYEILRSSPHFELFRVNKEETGNAIYWHVPNEVWISRLGLMTDRSREGLRRILTTPQNFDVRYVKDFVFRPTIRLRAESNGHPVEVYFDFSENAALIVQDGKLVWTLYIDNVSNKLQELLSDSPLK